MNVCSAFALTAAAIISVANVCRLCGIPHKRHLADGGVMRPAGLFGLVRAVPVVILSA